MVFLSMEFLKPSHFDKENKDSIKVTFLVVPSTAVPVWVGDTHNEVH